jgi:hypothetical protein
MKKTESKKSRDTVPLNNACLTNNLEPEPKLNVKLDPKTKIWIQNIASNVSSVPAVARTLLPDPQLQLAPRTQCLLPPRPQLLVPLQ